MLVLKFGGSSVGSAEGLANILGIVEARFKEQASPVVVVSALKGVTDELIAACLHAADGTDTSELIITALRKRHLDLARQFEIENEIRPELDLLLNELRSTIKGVYLLKEASPKTLDLVMSFGERLSAKFAAAAIARRVGTAESFDARELVITDKTFGNARVDLPTSYELIRSRLSGCPLPVVTGFIGSTPNGETTTLGRGGSDYSAAIVGAALGASEIEIWTDVDGVMTANPKLVPQAFTLPELSYREVMELSHFGAKVIYPPTIQPALDTAIPIRVKNTFKPQASGSLITEFGSASERPVTGISSISRVSMLTVEGSGLVGVEGTSSRVFGALARSHVNVILISQASSEHTICLAVDPGSAERARRAIEDEFRLELTARLLERIKVEENLCLLAVVGERMKQRPGVAAALFEALSKNGINVVAIAQGSSELNISVAISSRDEAKALNTLHDAFFLSELKTINLFLVGTGAIGSALLRQLAGHAETLKREHGYQFRLSGLSNSRKMLVSPGGIPFENGLEVLNQDGQPANIESFAHTLLNLNLPNSIFVDCTASEEVAGIYGKLLQAAVSIVTPNKKANSGPLERYQELKTKVRRSNAKFLFETTVGAGLPVIGTLNDLISSGDQIVQIEAVLSGTLSFIFNSFGPGKTFSSVVQEAKAKGYTEPDPRDDLSGKDVARKLLILAREMGLSVEEEQISVESLVPEDLRSAASIEEFMNRLPKFDESFEERRAEAEKNGRILRYLAKIEKGRAHVALSEVGPDNPFFKLSGSDNMISFTTDRYSDRPLVVQGPGAGVQVTAAGVFADLIRVASYVV